MVTVAKRELKARMPAYFRLVEQGGKELIVTDRGRSVLKIVPLDAELTVEQAFGDIRTHLHPKVDTESALLEPVSDEWEDA